MKWHYQAKKLVEGDTTTFVIVEAFETKKGKPMGHTSEPVYLTGETKEELIEVLQMAIADIQRHDVLEPEEVEDGYVLERLSPLVYETTKAKAGR